MTLFQQALNGTRRGSGGTRTSFGNKATKFLNGLNINARKLGVGARHLSSIGHLIDESSGGALSQYSAYNKGQKALTTIGRLAKDKDMDNANMQPMPRFMREHLGYRG